MLRVNSYNQVDTDLVESFFAKRSSHPHVYHQQQLRLHRCNTFTFGEKTISQNVLKEHCFKTFWKIHMAVIQVFGSHCYVFIFFLRRLRSRISNNLCQALAANHVLGPDLFAKESNKTRRHSAWNCDKQAAWEVRNTVLMTFSHSAPFFQMKFSLHVLSSALRSIDQSVTFLFQDLPTHNLTLVVLI